jgi:hypothetical protein
MRGKAHKIYASRKRSGYPHKMMRVTIPVPAKNAIFVTRYDEGRDYWKEVTWHRPPFCWSSYIVSLMFGDA